jgi:hypothetical protein
MAIKITDSVITDKGASTELYLNITDVRYSKHNSKMTIMVQTYLNESTRTVNINDTCDTFVIESTYIVDYIKEDLDKNAYELAYTKLQSLLEFTMEQI